KIPAPVFRLRDSDLELFLGRLWAGDGFVGSAKDAPFYATSSQQLAHDVDGLLLRLGILSGVHNKTFLYTYKGITQRRPGCTVHLLGEGSWEAFAQRILPHALGREQKTEAFRQFLQ